MVRCRWAGYVACLLIINTQLQEENLKGRDYLESLVIDGVIIFKWILKKQFVRV
jgi:hypothetical protein